MQENSCIEQSKQLEQLTQLNKAVKPYLNMSNQAQFSLLLTPDLDHVENLPELIKTLLLQHDLVNLKFDVIGKKKQFNELLMLLNTLDENDKQRIMLTLELPENSQRLGKKYSKDFFRFSESESRNSVSMAMTLKNQKMFINIYIIRLV